MAQPSHGPSSYSDPETAYGGADAVPETPDASPSGAHLDGPRESQRSGAIFSMRQNIRAGRWALVIFSVIFTLGLAGWVFFFLYWD